ncbi:MAG: type II secretion system protein GspG, partial [bacterium]
MKIKMDKKGFTLLEVTSMVVIVAFIISATLITFSKVREKNRDTMRISDITQLQNALATYYRDNDAYPALITS